MADMPATPATEVSIVIAFVIIYKNNHDHNKNAFAAHLAPLKASCISGAYLL